MARLTIELPDDVFADLEDIAAQLNQTPQGCLELAFNHFIQSDTLDMAILGMNALAETDEMIEFPEFMEEVNIPVEIHKNVLEELESEPEEAQLAILSEMIEKVFSDPSETELDEDEEDQDNDLELLLKEDASGQVFLANFSYGSFVYHISEDSLKIAFLNLENADELDELDELDDFEDPEELDEEQMDDDFDPDFEDELDGELDIEFEEEELLDSDSTDSVNSPSKFN